MELFDPAKPHFIVWVWIYDIDHPFRVIVPTAGPTSPEAVPLYYATVCGFRCLVDLDRNKVTPLQEASRRGHLDIVELVLGYDTNVDSHDEDGDTPLSWASLEGELDVIRVLLPVKDGVLILKPDTGELILGFG